MGLSTFNIQNITWSHLPKVSAPVAVTRTCPISMAEKNFKGTAITQRRCVRRPGATSPGPGQRLTRAVQTGPTWVDVIKRSFRTTDPTESESGIAEGDVHWLHCAITREDSVAEDKTRPCTHDIADALFIRLSLPDVLNPEDHFSEAHATPCITL